VPDTNQAFPRPLAVVTGASAGMGKVFAQQLAERGFDLVIVARDAERLRSVADELALQYGITATAWPADLSRDDGMRTLAEYISKQDRLMVLVNNAGFGTKGLFATRPVAEQATMLELHVMAPMILTRAALPGMLQRRAGVVINVASVASFMTSRGSVNYCATKAYERVMMESLALELEGTGVTAQALCPGFVHTEFHERGKMDMSNIPGFLWLEAPRVVKESLDAGFAGGPTTVIPGWHYRFIVWCFKVAPGFIRRSFQRRYSKSRVH
jgi:short-subunit dehydrogenase